MHPWQDPRSTSAKADRMCKNSVKNQSQLLIFAHKINQKNQVSHTNHFALNKSPAYQVLPLLPCWSRSCLRQLQVFLSLWEYSLTLFALCLTCLASRVCFFFLSIILRVLSKSRLVYLIMNSCSESASSSGRFWSWLIVRRCRKHNLNLVDCSDAEMNWMVALNCTMVQLSVEDLK